VSYSNHFDFLLFSAGIQIEDKPIVILSKDLFSTDFYWFETDEYSLPGQLAALSIVAKELSEGLSSFESAKHRIYNGVKEGSVYGSIGAFSFIENLEILLMLPGNELETVSYRHSKRYEDYLSRLRSDAEQLENNSKEAESMGDESSVELDKLTDVLSYLVKYLPNHITQFDLRAEPLYCKISILNHSFKSSFEPLPKTVQSLFDGLFTRLLKKVARKIDNYTDGQNEISKTNQNYYDQLKEVLEPVSFSYLRTSFLLYNSIMSGRYGKKEETDISLVAVGIGKTIENEINLSIIHYLRLKLGIELPAFFNRFQYGKIGQFYDEGPPEFIIQLNKQKKNHIVKNYDWLGPSLGTSSMATGIISDEPELAEIHEFFSNGNLNKLLELIQVLPSVRNAGGHPYTSITNKDIEKMFKMVWDLLEAGIFHDMKQLRLKLSTNKGEFYGLY
jgi:hypothetical protein